MENQPHQDFTGTPSKIKDEIISMGARFDESVIQRIIKLYMPLHKKVNAESKGIHISKDLSYGSHERHRLDIHSPEVKPGKSVPIVVFFHGGGFVAGEKNTVGDLIYGNVANYFAEKGMLGVNATYRLAPRHQWPSGAMDVAGVVKWLHANGGKYNGDIKKIFLFGHSAGATHVSTYIFHEKFQPGNGAGVAGAILMSGQYNPDPENPGRYNKAYYGSDTDKYAERAVIHYTDGLNIPVFIIMAEFDPYDIAIQSVDLFAALCRKHTCCPRFTRIKHHNHLSESIHINTADESIGPEIVDFIHTGR